ncbi:MAG TPA: type II secretion system protein GspC [Gammaproteobacteria bacterium]|nr:type II secretion system protein GspC [Gammaproteobacteria bacterium]
MTGHWRISGEELKSRASGSALARRAPDIVGLALMIAIAYVLARLTWLAVPAPNDTALAAAPVAASAATPGEADTLELANKVAAMHLFGRANAPAPTGEAVNAPETNLNVTLHGIIAADDPERSRAIIAAGSGRGGDAKSYRVGADIPGGASIHGIFADRVILSRNGHLEALKLPRESEGGSGVVRVPPQNTAPPQAQRRAPPVQFRREPSSRLQHATMALGQLVQAQRAMVNGKLIGYKLYPGSNPAAFLGAGLEPGDLVTAVNGKPVSNPANLMMLMGKGTSDKPIELTVKRDGRTRHVRISVPH